MVTSLRATLTRVRVWTAEARILLGQGQSTPRWVAALALTPFVSGRRDVIDSPNLYRTLVVFVKRKIDALRYPLAGPRFTNK